MVIFIKKRFIIMSLLVVCLVITGIVIYGYMNSREDGKIILGGNLIVLEEEINSKEVFSEEIDVEKYFRPSKLPVLNDKTDTDGLLNQVEMNNGKEIAIPKEFIINPEDSIINYFSLLREAANPVEGKFTGCGSLGFSKAPYPIGYNFFSEEYKEKVSYKKYEDSFKNILHINLIKLKEIAKGENGELKYFYEVETIQGSETGVGYFAYYYGYITLIKDSDVYRISEISTIPEQYLCAPYHSWFYDGNTSVSFKYGDWCKLIKKTTKVEQDGYVKDIYFEGTDGNEYKIEFYILTNDYDIEVAQFRKTSNGEWKRIYLNPNDCLKK